ncbi:hypothetical protein PHET_12018, partial [Paragonimus heterotremus]
IVQLAQWTSVYEATLRQLNYDFGLNSSRAIETIVQKLPPPELHFRWTDRAAIITGYGIGPQFTDLTKFVVERADAASMRYSELAKAQVSPIRLTSLLRLELAAVVVAVKLAQPKESELELPNESTTFCSDSTIVLYDVLNSSKRFQTFYANQLATVPEASQPKQGHYADTKRNLADLASHGIYAY